MPRCYATRSAQSTEDSQYIKYTDSHLFRDGVGTDHRRENATYYGRNP